MRRAPIQRLKALPKIDPKKGFSYYTETVRHHKSQVLMYQDKIKNEFPTLKTYALPYNPLEEKEKIIKYTRSRTIYPGLDGSCIDPNYSTCKLEVELSSLGDEIRNSTILIAGDKYDPNTNTISYECRKFENYEENKSWLRDSFFRLLECARKEKFSIKSGEEKKLEFPEEWKVIEENK